MASVFVKIFKVLTSVILVAILISLVNERELYTFVTKKDSKTTSTPSKEVPTDSSLSSSEITAVDLKKEILPATTTSVTIPTPKKEVEQTQYVSVAEGALDTDHTYKPLVSPCKVPVGYKIGTLDMRFGITKEELKKEIELASLVWEQEAKKNLFYYDEAGSLTINLIYDERQSRTKEVQLLALEIENAKQTAANIQNAYEKEKVIYAREGEELKKDVESFQLRYDAYNSKVESYNARGGASKIEYEAMMSELAGLKVEAKQLDERKSSLIIMMESINKKVARYNEFVAYINSLIKRSNALGGKKFTEGRFVPSTNTIDIYQYSDLLKLRRVISHELGHALGISWHTENIYSIMYTVNSATTTVLSKEDKEAFAEACSSY